MQLPAGIHGSTRVFARRTFSANERRARAATTNQPLGLLAPLSEGSFLSSFFPPPRVFSTPVNQPPRLRICKEAPLRSESRQEAYPPIRGGEKRKDPPPIGWRMRAPTQAHLFSRREGAPEPSASRLRPAHPPASLPATQKPLRSCNVAGYVGACAVRRERKKSEAG